MALMELLDMDLTSKQLQKYLFLLTRGEEDSPYDFVPYLYGCFSFQANQDVATLVKNGYLSFIEGHGERRVRLSRNENFFMSLDMFEQQRIREIKDAFGGMTQDELIHYTYVKYPYYATKSVIAADLLDKAGLAAVESQKHHFEEPQLFTIGYEGRSLEKYINILIFNDVHILCDVRKNAYSQKFGFSKSQLEKACNGVGITYIHLPQLGIESGLRQSLNTQDDYDRLFDLYEGSTLAANMEALLYINDLITTDKRVALTCFEADPRQCHRTRIAKRLISLPNIDYTLIQL